MSLLATALEDYLRTRRALGFKLDRAAHLLPDFIRYVERAGVATITTELALAWAQQPADANPVWWADRLVSRLGNTWYNW